MKGRDDVGLVVLFKEIESIRQKLITDDFRKTNPAFKDRGINSKELNKVIKLAQKHFTVQPDRSFNS